MLLAAAAAAPAERVKLAPSLESCCVPVFAHTESSSDNQSGIHKEQRALPLIAP